MYIRRKVFSVLTDQYGEERYFSTTEFMNEEDYLAQHIYTDVYDSTGKFIGDAAKDATKRDAKYYEGLAGISKDGSYGVSGEIRKAEEEFMNSAKFKSATQAEKEMLLKDFRLGQTKDRLKKNVDARKAGKAAEKKANSLVGKAQAWAKKNPKLAMAAAATTGTAAIGGGVIAARKK